LLQAIDDWVDEVPSAILDYGCGTGRHSFLIAAKWSEARIVGLDIDDEALAVGRRRAVKRGRGEVSFSQESSFPWRWGFFDLAICIDVLEHIPDDLHVLRRVAYLVKEGGLLILHTPALGQRRYWGVNCTDARHAGGEDFGHVREGYDEDELKGLLCRAGFVPGSFRRTVGKAAAWLTDLDYRLARWRLYPLRAATYLAARRAARLELDHYPATGRGIMAIARRSEAWRPWSSVRGAGTDDLWNGLSLM
jgi:SAM-dependent methyltransferase